ncbi:F0F1 ATP synthase subunit alpha, partial [bacterium]|nr:F0F1 ATP synthase subunit alpha [bacterium]
PSLKPIKSESTRPAERLAPGIVERVPVCSPLETGITAIDCLIPIGKGQRELLIGNRSTGKTSIIVDTILHQKNKDVTCIYVSIGHKKSNAAKIIDTLERNGAMEYTTVVLARAHDSAMSQFIAPYTACAMGEHFMEQGKDVAVFYNDLSNHAVAYRELSLLLRRPPGREAYPGDIFYIHSRLLERACKLSPERGGGSLTAIPVVQTQDDDISAYIPTNLISITDGQIFLDVSLFNQGIRPAVNVGLSVSRVGGAAQTKAIKQMAGRMKLDLAQYESLLDFAQFGSELDKESQARLDHGRRAIEILKQGRYETHSFSDQVLFLYLLRERFLDQFKLEDVKEFATQFASYVSEMYPEIYEKISEDEALEDTVLEEIKEIAEEFSLTFPKV